jgi:hypothetical protein
MKENPGPLKTARGIWPLLAVVCCLVSLVALFYAEEDLRGWLAWKNCEAELDAKGDVLDWSAYIPPPVSDAENVFKAPDMAAWFVRQESHSTSKLTTLLRRDYDKTPVPFVELTVLNASTNAGTELGGADLVLRYSSFGSALFEDIDSRDSANIPAIVVDDVPISIVIENLARQFHLNYSIDPKIGYGQRDPYGHFKPEPMVSARWRNITAREALLAFLNRYNLQLVENANSGPALITTKDPAAPKIYASDSTRRKLENLLRTTFQKNFGEDTIADMGFILLTNSLAEIKPARMVLISEDTPADNEIVSIVRQFCPDDVTQNNWLGMNVERSGGNSLRVVLHAQSAADYLAWSDQFQPEFNEIREALKRPLARMDGDYARPSDMPVLDFVTVRVLVQTLSQRAKCDLLLGQSEKALSELTLLHDLCHLLEAPPSGKPMTLVAAMINVAVTGLYVNTLAVGLQLHSWKEPQLAELQKQLAEINLPPWVMLALREESAAACRMVETLPAAKVANRNANNTERLQIKIGDWVLNRLWARGWSYQNMAHLAALYHNFQQGFSPAQTTMLPHKFQEAASEVSQFTGQSQSPYTFLAASLIPNLSKAAQATAHNQTSANEAQIACALERYHLSHGEYPETLEAMVPEFLIKVPVDVIGGAPLHYRREADGTFLLYSVSWNESDDNGSPGKDWNDTNGDWVWKT